MGVNAPLGITRAYYFAYPIGLFVSFMVYWGVCWKWPVEIQYKLSEWMEVKDYVREEERSDEEGSRWGSMVSGEEEGQLRTGVLESGEKGDFEVEKGTAAGYRGPETRMAER